jgi:hypothetical protein
MVIHKLGKNKGFLALAVILLALVIYAVFFRTPHVRKQAPIKATIKQLPSKTAANGGEKQIDVPTDNNQGTSTDKQGHAAASNPSNLWVQSSSGAITLKQPVSGSTIASGIEVSGSANVDKVQYRLIDNDRGVISQGFINVVNGSFSATISFNGHGSQGRLDVFSTNVNGAETNEVQVPVTFKT